jgi:hypothetical protein
MIIDELFEAPQQCPECGGISFSDLILAEKKDACYHKVKASAKVWPSAYASGRLVQCRKKGAANYGNSKNESMSEGEVIPFKRPQPQTAASWQNLPKDVLYLANDWFWADYEGSGLDATMDPKGLGSGFANQQKYLGAQLQQRGWAIDIDDEFENVVLKNKQGQTILLPIEDAQTFSGWAKGTNSVTEQDVAEAPLPGQRRGPLDLQPLEGPGSGGGGGGGGGPSRSGPSPFTPVKIPGTNINIPGVTQSTSPPPVVTKPPNINRQIDPASDVPAYVRKGLPDPVTAPVGKPKITVRPGETQSQAMQRTKAEQEFGRFLQGQGGQSFGTAGAGRGGQGGPTAAQATSGSNQIPTIKLPNGQTIPDPARLSPSGQYNTQSGSSQASGNVGDKEAYNAALKIRKNQWNQMKTGKEKESEKRPSAWKTPETDIELEEQSRKKQPPEVKYDDEYDAMVARVKKLAGLGPMRTVYDPTKRVYRNMPTAVQPKK